LVVKGAENHILKAYLEGVTEGRECANDYSVTLVNQRHHRYVIYIAYFFLQFYFSNSVFLFSRELFPQLIASFQKIILLSSVGFEEYVVGEENSFFSFQELHDLIKMQKIGISSVPALWVWVPREAKNRYQFSAHSVGMSTVYPFQCAPHEHKYRICISEWGIFSKFFWMSMVPYIHK
jgi:hypothetical protein